MRSHPTYHCFFFFYNLLTEGWKSQTQICSCPIKKRKQKKKESAVAGLHFLRGPSPSNSLDGALIRCWAQKVFPQKYQNFSRLLGSLAVAARSRFIPSPHLRARARSLENFSPSRSAESHLPHRSPAWRRSRWRRRRRRRRPRLSSSSSTSPPPSRYPLRSLARLPSAQNTMHIERA